MVVAKKVLNRRDRHGRASDALEKDSNCPEERLRFGPRLVVDMKRRERAKCGQVAAGCV